MGSSAASHWVGCVLVWSRRGKAGQTGTKNYSWVLNHHRGETAAVMGIGTATAVAGCYRVAMRYILSAMLLRLPIVKMAVGAVVGA